MEGKNESVANLFYIQFIESFEPSKALDTPLHYHDAYEITNVLEGKAVFKIDDKVYDVDDGSILFTARSERSQERNRHAASERLAALIRTALIEPKIRKKTRPTKGSQERRIESKKRRGATKSQRGRQGWD